MGDIRRRTGLAAAAPEDEDDAPEMLKRLHVSSTNYISTIADRDRLADLVDKEWAGPLLHTLLIAPGGTVIYRHTDQIDPFEVRRAIADHLGVHGRRSRAGT